MSDVISVVLADDHPVVRTGIKGALEVEDNIKVIGEASDGNEAQTLCQELLPDVLLLDLNMPGPRATDTIAAVRETCPSTKIVMLTAHTAWPGAVSQGRSR